MEREDIRIRVAGIYVENGKILLVKHRKYNREYYLLPGGGQHAGEKAADTLIREWKEELSLDIVPGEFLFLGESIPPDIDSRKCVYQVVFAVSKISGEIQLHADDTLVGQAWVDINLLPSLVLYPLCMDQILACIHGEKQPSYQTYVWG
jgi:ADP-ribose pyrophosphatase YjhB (NUDIX family)